jgi:crotonobetainyl-CoA:carnitine CoA-transferase CaiB-like acyl-CoA transferase
LFKLSKTPGNVKYPAPYLGENNQEVLSAELGYTEQQIAKLSEEGVI